MYKSSLKNKTKLENVHYQIATHNYIKLHYQNIKALVWREENWSKIQKRKSTNRLTHTCLIKFDSLSAVWETWVQPLGQEDPPEKEMATHSSILAWKIPQTEEADRLQPMGLQRVGHDWVTNTKFDSEAKKIKKKKSVERRS